jgi:Domain of unknown function (DUF1816)
MSLAMKLKHFLKESYITVLAQVGKAWWVKIETEQPSCIYYFGPFGNQTEAAEAKPDYLQDLETEQAQGISWHIEQCNPSQLTLF